MASCERATVGRTWAHSIGVGRICPDAILGHRASLWSTPAAYDALAALTATERQEIAASQAEILRAWALVVGPPLLAGLLPFGLGPMAAANYM